MPRFIVILAIIAGGVWFAFQFVEPPAVETVQTSSPQERLQQIIRSGSVDARELESLCSLAPALAARMLRDAPLRVRGTIDGINTSGLAGRKANLVLAKGTRQVVLSYDLDRYAVLRLAPPRTRNWQFLVVDQELMIVDPDKKNRELLAQNRTSYSEDVVFDRITPTAILLNAGLPRQFANF